MTEEPDRETFRQVFARMLRRVADLDENERFRKDLDGLAGYIEQLPEDDQDWLLIENAWSMHLHPADFRTNTGFLGAWLGLRHGELSDSDPEPEFGDGHGPEEFLRRWLAKRLESSGRGVSFRTAVQALMVEVFGRLRDQVVMGLELAEVARLVEAEEDPVLRAALLSYAETKAGYMLDQAVLTAAETRPVSQLAAALGISPQAVRQRILRLEDEMYSPASDEDEHLDETD